MVGARHHRAHGGGGQVPPGCSGGGVPLLAAGRRPVPSRVDGQDFGHDARASARGAGGLQAPGPPPPEPTKPWPGGPCRAPRPRPSPMPPRPTLPPEPACCGRRQRGLPTWTGADGSWNLGLHTTPEAGAELHAALAPRREALFQAARLQGRSEPVEAYAADALHELVRLAVGASAGGGADARAQARGGEDPAARAPDEGAGTGAEPEPEWANRSWRPDTKLIVLIDHQALRRGHAEEGETCEIAGVGPISVASARSLMADAFGAAVVTKGVDVCSVAHLGRSVNAHQRTPWRPAATAARYPAVVGADAWRSTTSRTGHLTWRTMLDSLVWLCRRHHLDKTHRGWRLDGPPGERRWTRTPAPSGGPEPPGLPAAAIGSLALPCTRRGWGTKRRHHRFLHPLRRPHRGLSFYARWLACSAACARAGSAGRPSLVDRREATAGLPPPEELQAGIDAGHRRHRQPRCRPGGQPSGRLVHSRRGHVRPHPQGG